VTAAIITLLLTAALASFLLPNLSPSTDFHSLYVLPQAVRGLVALVSLFDLYTIYQHLQIHRIRRQLIEREELFHLVSENAAITEPLGSNVVIVPSGCRKKPWRLMDISW